MTDDGTSAAGRGLRRDAHRNREELVRAAVAAFHREASRSR